MLPILALVSAIAASVPPMVSDTPPAPPTAAALAKMQSPMDVTAASRLPDGTPVAPHTHLPHLANKAEVVRYMLEHYPPALDDRNDAAMPWVWMLVDKNGKPGPLHIIKPSGRDAFDSLAVRSLRVARFAPATVDGVPIDVWIPLPIQIAREDIAKAPKPSPEGPFFTPYTTKPELENRQEVAQALVRHYPPALRQGGVGGVALTWIFLNRSGEVERAQIKTTSGHPEIDEAALAVARVMKFSPALKGAEAVSVWIALPITFRTQ